eukprot:scaffold116472_cov18-Tisochrysis_lutea.AAC.1
MHVFTPSIPSSCAVGSTKKGRHVVLTRAVADQVRAEPISRAGVGPRVKCRHGNRNDSEQSVLATPPLQPITSSSVLSKLCEDAEVLQLYRYPALGASQLHTLLRKAKNKVTDAITDIDSELVSLHAPEHQQLILAANVQLETAAVGGKDIPQL